MKKKEKVEDLKRVVKSFIDRDFVRFETHSRQRMIQRSITRFDIDRILLSGWRVPARDRWRNKGGWTYCFEGLDEESRRLRVIVAIEDNLIIVTVVDITK